MFLTAISRKPVLGCIDLEGDASGRFPLARASGCVCSNALVVTAKGVHAGVAVAIGYVDFAVRADDFFGAAQIGRLGSPAYARPPVFAAPHP